MNNIIEIKDLSFSYNNVQVLEHITMDVPSNSFIGIIGPNGAGKTTLMRIITGLLQPASGSVRIFGKEPRVQSELIGYVPQHSFTDISFPITVFDAVLLGRVTRKKMLKRFNNEDRSASCKALKAVGMYDFKDRLIMSLSGGQRQRVLLARALATDPKLLIMDEPLAGIDMCLEFELYEQLKRIKAQMTVILISHDVGVMSQHVDNIFCLNKKLFCHESKEEALKNLDKVYGCPVDIIAHGTPHRVLKEH